MRRLVVRFGVAGFVFFAAKGMLWMLIPALLAARAVGGAL